MKTWYVMRTATFARFSLAGACLIVLLAESPTAASLPEAHTAAAVKVALQDAAQEINSRLPRMFDADFRLDSMTAGNREFRYNLTLVNYLAAEISGAVIQQKIHRTLIDNFCRGETLRVFLENKIPITYIYYGKDGKEIVRIKVSPAQC